MGNTQGENNAGQEHTHRNTTDLVEDNNLVNKGLKEITHQGTPNEKKRRILTQRNTTDLVEDNNLIDERLKETTHWGTPNEKKMQGRNSLREIPLTQSRMITSSTKD